ncbi:branched-chain amino acid ABC transporter permease [Lachnospiraceae bacterium ZAX-1]
MNKINTPQKRSNFLSSFFNNEYLRFCLFGLLLCVLVLLTNAGLMKTSTLSYLGNVLVYAVAALGLNLLLGYSGLISLGTAGFMGLGAYLAAYVTGDLGIHVGISFWIALLAAIFIPTLIGVLIGAISLRVRSIYLGIATLCISEILHKTFEEASFITGGMQGKKAKYPIIFGFEFDRNATFILFVIILVLVMMLTYNIVNGQMGRALHAMRGSEVAAQAMGINLLKYRLIAFAIATAYAGLAGLMYVFFVKFSYPDVWTLNLSLYILAAVVIGGLRSIYGSVIGAFVVWAVPDLILKNLPVIQDINGMAYIFNGILIILVIIFFPNGLSGLGIIIKNAILRLFKKDKPQFADVKNGKDGA